MLRKLTPYALFLALGLVMLAGAAYGPALILKFYGAVPTGGLAATGAENAAGRQAAGWVPSALVASKFITAAGAYLLAVLLIWQVQKLTHPGPTRWARHDYTADFNALSPVDKFEVYGRVRLQHVLLFLGGLLFAALVV